MAFATLSLAGDGAGAWYPPGETNDPLDTAGLVARVRILRRDPLFFEFEGKKRPCGVSYQAEVLESLKGPVSGKITFVSRQDVAKFERREFLVVADPRSEAALRGDFGAVPSVSEEDKRHSQCSARGGEYQVRSFSNGVVPFAISGPAGSSGLWLDWEVEDCCVGNLATLHAVRRSDVEGFRWLVPWDS
jgi:hypothetical protein